MIAIGFEETLWFIMLINGVISKMMYKTVDLLNEKAIFIRLLFILLTGPVAPKFVNHSYNPKIS